MVVETLRSKEQSSRLSKANELFDIVGLHTFSDAELPQLFDLTIDELSEWKPINTFLEPARSTDILVPGRKTLVIVVGGSKLRFQGYESDSLTTIRAVGPERPDQILIRNKQFPDASTFFKTIIEQGKHQIDRFVQMAGPIDILTIVFSFDGTAEPNELGLDIWPNEDRLSKGFSARGIGQARVGESFSRALRDAGYPLADNHTIIVTNDIADAMGAIPDSMISLVFGTGFNIGSVRMINGVLRMVNLEAANLKSYPLAGPEIHSQRESLSLDSHNAEFIASGKGIEGTLNNAVKLLNSSEVIFNYQPNALLEAIHLSSILSGNKLSVAERFLNYDLKDTESWAILEELAKRIRNRAATVVGVSTAAVIATTPELQNRNHIVIPYAGSTFMIPGFDRMVAQNVSLLTDKDITFSEIQETVGAAFLGIREDAKTHP
jgi:hexokinase